MFGTRQRLFISNIYILFAAYSTADSNIKDSRWPNKSVYKIVRQKPSDSSQASSNILSEITKNANDSAINEENGYQKSTVKNDNEENTSEELEKFKIKNPLLNYKAKDTPIFKLTPEQTQKFKIWPDGVIPYYIDVVSYSDKVFRDLIRESLATTNTITGLSFVELPSPPSNNDERWVFFVNRRGMLGCADHTVKNFTHRGVQPVIIGYDCAISKGELAEAVMSILGIPAQHNAPDRDNYITVNMDNILPDKRYLFDKVAPDEWIFQNLQYDIESVTHYDMHKYSANGRTTIEVKDGLPDINPSRSYSLTDIFKIKTLYGHVMKSKRLQVPACQKLFMPVNKFVKYPRPVQKSKNPSSSNIQSLKFAKPLDILDDLTDYPDNK